MKNSSLTPLIVLILLVTVFPSPTLQLECLTDQIKGLGSDGITPECKPKIPKCSQYSTSGDCLACNDFFYASEDRK